MAAWHNNIPAGAWPLLLPGPMAAAYVGRSYNQFRNEMKAGKWPHSIDATRGPLWDRRDLDDAAAKLGSKTSSLAEKMRGIREAQARP